MTGVQTCALPICSNASGVQGFEEFKEFKEFKGSRDWGKIKETKTYCGLCAYCGLIKQVADEKLSLNLKSESRENENYKFT